MIRSVTGNLLEAPVEALVNTVNCVGVMAKGIALQFKQAYPDMFAAYAKAARAGEIVPGRIHVWSTGLVVGPRYIFNFPTKRHWRHPSRMADIEAGLVDLVAKVRELGIRSIAVPPLGAGSGGLHWEVVKPRIEASLATLPEVEVLVFEPHGEPLPQDRIVRTERPALTVARALFLQLMDVYQIPDFSMTLLEVQKLAYFLQETGEPLRLAFKKAPYGPYADNLNQVLRRLEGHFLLGATDARPGTELKLLPGAAQESAGFLRDHADARARLERVQRLINGFETPYGLELLSTVHWVTRHDPAATDDFEVCLQGVFRWSSRKRRLMRPEHVRFAWERLRDHGWLAALAEADR
jgi:O-acetyl-ADP-ribose deacetylase (regulator of RNase III)